jgi:hypothetical protein
LRPSWATDPKKGARPFVGSCVAVGWMIWKNEKKSKGKAGQQ